MFSEGTKHSALDTPRLVIAVECECGVGLEHNSQVQAPKRIL